MFITTFHEGRATHPSKKVKNIKENGTKISHVPYISFVVNEIIGQIFTLNVDYKIPVYLPLKKVKFRSYSDYSIKKDSV